MVKGKITQRWQDMRQQVLDSFSIHHTGCSTENIDFDNDAYNSLKIEGYPVTPELIRTAKYSSVIPKDEYTEEDKTNMVVEGYFQAFSKVLTTIELFKETHKSPVELVGNDYQKWYTAMWQPFIDAGIIKTSDIAGFRNRPVYIHGASHVPPSSDKVVDYMEEFFECLKNEPYASVRAILGHYFFTWIHPYNDGNGRMARFLMNVMLTTGGYSWITIPVDRREDYLRALDNATKERNITEFTEFICSL